jgi:predicted nucleic acid-binding Zn ribbon protein
MKKNKRLRTILLLMFTVTFLGIMAMSVVSGVGAKYS